MQSVRCTIPVPGTCWGKCPIPVPGTCWGRRAMSFASIRCRTAVGFRCQAPVGAELDLLAMQGVKCPIPVPGTCWGRARFASNAGRQVLDSGARHLLGRARFASDAGR